jgi:hypothetical protein
MFNVINSETNDPKTTCIYLSLYVFVTIVLNLYLISSPIVIKLVGSQYSVTCISDYDGVRIGDWI